MLLRNQLALINKTHGWDSWCVRAPTQVYGGLTLWTDARRCTSQRFFVQRVSYRCSNGLEVWVCINQSLSVSLTFSLMQVWTLRTFFFFFFPFSRLIASLQPHPIVVSPFPSLSLLSKPWLSALSSRSCCCLAFGSFQRKYVQLCVFQPLDWKQKMKARQFSWSTSPILQGVKGLWSRWTFTSLKSTHPSSALGFCAGRPHQYRESAQSGD